MLMKISSIGMRTSICLLTIITVGLAVTGCAAIAPDTPRADLNSFGPAKKFAVVSIASPKAFQVVQGMSQMFRSPEAIPGANTQALLDQLTPKIISALGNSKQFTLFPDDALLTSRAYQNLAEDEKTTGKFFASNAMNVSSRYKYIADEEKYAALAQYLGVDAVIGITIQFGIYTSKNYLAKAGVRLGEGAYSAVTTLSVIAYNNRGELIWKDSVIQEVDPNDSQAVIVLNTAGMTSADFEKFHPFALATGEKTVGVLLSRLDSMMVGNAVYRMMQKNNMYQIDTLPPLHKTLPQLPWLY